jgi:hypothetical protein
VESEVLVASPKAMGERIEPGEHSAWRCPYHGSFGSLGRFEVLHKVEDLHVGADSWIESHSIHFVGSTRLLVILCFKH